MKRLWPLYVQKVGALPARERAMIFIAGMAVALFIANALFLDPLLTRKKALVSRAKQQQAELQVLQADILALRSKLAAPGASNMARRAVVERQIAEIDGKLQDTQQSLVPAQNMRAVLQEVLIRNPRLQLIAVRTLPVTPLIERQGKADKSAAAGMPQDQPVPAESGVFKHGVQITLQGSYADMYEYLARLEKLPWRMYWSRASLSAGDYPRLMMTVTIYTLSLDRAWLVV